jgi:hypothetical protein
VRGSSLAGCGALPSRSLPSRRALAIRDVVVRSLSAEWSGFGSWSIEASKGESEDRRGAAIETGDYGAVGPDVVRVSWDGKDGILDVGLLHTTAISASGALDPLMSQSCDSRSDALRVAESLLLDRLAN